ncbi:hypothetical protein L596_015800 [Steinernema carpocapsae]|uniref:Uncharacterized protein n=1 Tax=Steinernema carpocapsae TaxID=34508 RepID=A0A4U5NG41_STECR|nr:hypothetical protein L596_015800 [Steinernema carpocapsae]
MQARPPQLPKNTLKSKSALKINLLTSHGSKPHPRILPTNGPPERRVPFGDELLLGLYLDDSFGIRRRCHEQL